MQLLYLAQHNFRLTDVFTMSLSRKINIQELKHWRVLEFVPSAIALNIATTLKIEEPHSSLSVTVMVRLPFVLHMHNEPYRVLQQGFLSQDSADCNSPSSCKLAAFVQGLANDVWYAEVVGRHLWDYYKWSPKKIAQVCSRLTPFPQPLTDHSETVVLLENSSFRVLWSSWISWKLLWRQTRGELYWIYVCFSICTCIGTDISCIFDRARD